MKLEVETLEVPPQIALAGLHDSLSRMAVMLRWLTFVVMHTALAVLLLALAWANHTSAMQVWAWLNRAAQSRPWMFLAAAGVSLATLWQLYAKAWLWLYRRLLPKGNLGSTL